MLILTRKKQELIRIGDDIVIKVIRTGKNNVKIGVEAPQHIRVLRGELQEHETPPPKMDSFRFSETDADQHACVVSDQYPHAA